MKMKAITARQGQEVTTHRLMKTKENLFEENLSNDSVHLLENIYFD
jgi:hypothetical protein